MSAVKYCVFEYLYRDASNYKQFNAIRLTGTVSDETLKRLRDSLDGDWFIPEQVGLEALQFRFLEYGPWAGPLAGRTRGTLVSMEAGTIVAFALANLQERSTLFVSPGDTVYEGMIVGENARPGDMDVNPTKEKKLTNMRSKSSDENVQLEPPRELTLEGALEYIEDDELIEVTPGAIRLRKRFLSANDRKKLSREAKRERALL